ncbi:hypothetical protein CCYA_CCYA16G4184 [Cyanidiococcus yangmingshanensis]|nr:hypothetical protein CCYA_CCYA16G4184 [Cyanidiococcus yangmingshanensis]
MGSDARHFCWDLSPEQVRLKDFGAVDSTGVCSESRMVLDGGVNADGGVSRRVESCVQRTLSTHRVCSDSGAECFGVYVDSGNSSGREGHLSGGEQGRPCTGTGLGCEPLTPPVERSQAPSERGLAVPSVSTGTDARALRTQGVGNSAPEGGSGSVQPVSLQEDWSGVYARLLQAVQRTRELEVQLSLAKSEMLRLQAECLKSSWARRYVGRPDMMTNVSETGVSWDISMPGVGYQETRPTSMTSATTNQGLILGVAAESRARGNLSSVAQDLPPVLGQTLPGVPRQVYPSQSISSYTNDFTEMASIFRKSETSGEHRAACDCSTASSGTDDDDDDRPSGFKHGTTGPLPGTASLGTKTSLPHFSEHAAMRTSSRSKRRRRTPPLPGTTRYWTESEHRLFLEALKIYGHRNLKAISAYVGTRNATQVRTHIQKYFMRLTREAQRLEEGRKSSPQSAAKTGPQAAASNGDADSVQSDSSKRFAEPNGSALTELNACLQVQHIHAAPRPPEQRPGGPGGSHASKLVEKDKIIDGQTNSVLNHDEADHPREVRRRPFNTVPDTCGVHLLSLVAQENML